MKIKLFLLFFVVSCTGCTNLVVGTHEPPEAMVKCAAEILNRSPSEALITLKAVRSLESATATKYLKDGHLYTTLKVSLESGIPMDRALMLSYYTQYPDIDKNYEATPVAIKSFLWLPAWSWRDVVTGKLHSLHGGERSVIDARRQELKDALNTSLQDETMDWYSGLLIHALGDAYAHTHGGYAASDEKAYGKVFGHALDSLFNKSPDEVCKSRNTAKYIGYLQALREAFGSPVSTTREEVDKSCAAGQFSAFGPRIDWDESVPTDKKSNDAENFLKCMNKTVRPLNVDEVKLVAGAITTGV